MQPLGRRRSLKGVRHLRLPGQTILAEDLRRDLEVLGALQQAGADNDLVAQDGLMVVHVGGAVGAVVAMDGLAWREFSGLLGHGWWHEAVGTGRRGALREEEIGVSG